MDLRHRAEVVAAVSQQGSDPDLALSRCLKYYPFAGLFYHPRQSRRKNHLTYYSLKFNTTTYTRFSEICIYV